VRWVVPLLFLGAAAWAVPSSTNPAPVKVCASGNCATVSGGALKTDASATTQPVSGTVTVGNQSATTSAVAVRCVNAAGDAFEGCGGGSSSGGGLSDAELRATPVPVSGTVTATDGSGALTVDGAVTVSDGSGALNVIVDSSASIAVTGPATDAQLRAAPLPVSGTVTASGPVTDAQIRATPLPVSGTVTVGTLPALVAGSANIGDVDVLTLPAISISQTTTSNDVDVATLPSVTVGTFPDNEPINVAQINGVTPLMGAGATGTGSLRVTVASDSTGYGTANGTIPTQSQLGSGRAVAYGSSPAAVAAGNNAPIIADLEGRPYVNTGHPRSIICNLSTTATSSTQVTGCEVVASNSIWVTSITVGGGVATGATAPAVIQSGTSTACTGPAVFYRCGHPAQSTCTIPFNPAVKLTQAHGICLLDATVGTKWVTITGFVAP
jgi:hypothetical protein